MHRNSGPQTSHSAGGPGRVREKSRIARLSWISALPARRVCSFRGWPVAGSARERHPQPRRELDQRRRGRARRRWPRRRAPSPSRARARPAPPGRRARSAPSRRRPAARRRAPGRRSAVSSPNGRLAPRMNTCCSRILLELLGIGRSSVAAETQPSGDRGLAVGDAAVVDRQPLGDEHAQRRRRSSRRQTDVEQPPVLEHAARQHDDARSPCGRGQRGARLARWRAAIVAWKRRAIAPGGLAGATSAATARIVSRGSITRSRARPLSDIGYEPRSPGSQARLELDRRLALVVDLGADPAQRRDRVEQPAHAGRRRRGRAASRSSRCTCAQARGVDLRPRAIAGSSGSPPPSDADSHAHAIRHGCADRALAAGQRAPAAATRRGGTPRGRRAATRRPRPCRRARTRCRRRSRRSRARARRARRGTPPGGRGGAGRRSARRRRARARTWSTGTRGGGRGRRPRARPRTALEVLDPVGERAQRLVVLEVADVVADPRAFALGQAERVLELGAAGEQRPRRSGAGRALGWRARSRASGAGTWAPRDTRPPARPSRRCASGSAGRGPGTGRRSRAAARARRRRS